MAVDLRMCGQDEGSNALRRGVEAILSGVDGDLRGVLPQACSAEEHDVQWRHFLAQHLEPIKRAVLESYNGTIAMRLEDVLAASESCFSRSTTTENLNAGAELAREVLSTTKGALHERLLERLSRAWETGAGDGHPAVSVAVKAATFHESLPAAQVAYFFHEWRASGARLKTLRTNRLDHFLTTNSTELVAVASVPSADCLPFSSQSSR